jgi:hypothetical protein
MCVDLFEKDGIRVLLSVVPDFQGDESVNDLQIYFRHVQAAHNEQLIWEILDAPEWFWSLYFSEITGTSFRLLLSSCPTEPSKGSLACLSPMSYYIFKWQSSNPASNQRLVATWNTTLTRTKRLMATFMISKAPNMPLSSANPPDMENSSGSIKLLQKQ